jgi:hypothetical protein
MEIMLNILFVYSVKRCIKVCVEGSNKVQRTPQIQLFDIWPSWWLNNNVQTNFNLSYALMECCLFSIVFMKAIRMLERACWNFKIVGCASDYQALLWYSKKCDKLRCFSIIDCDKQNFSCSWEIKETISVRSQLAKQYICF